MLIETIGWVPTDIQVQLLEAAAYVNGYSVHRHGNNNLEVYPKGFVTNSAIVQ